ncbi:MAG: hypothetical protein PHQ15_02065 [Methanosarcina sp.]|jgi:hypothetical protein|nr:hypothetical protein [Methanosarcina sp.]MDD3318194.1 hypothetical protein [Methanosarcina sp.]MDD3901750.1 hypothetical protein [Dysgonamonadaceae bacterium]MDD4619597.1 hypothetical protein [Methanosarcina sp.]
MNSSSWTENILNLATFLTSIVSLFTLNELRKQRYLANSPKLHIVSKKNVISATNKRIQNIDKELPIKWESEFLKEITGGFPPMYSIPLNLINIGSSPALNVKTIWNYDKEGREKTLNIFNQFNDLNLGMKCEILNDSSLRITDQRVRTDISMQLMPINIEYVFPFSESNKESEILIPYPYFLIIAFNLSVLSLSENSHDLSVPTLYAEISYYDNINTLYKETFSIRCNIFNLQWLYLNKSTNEKAFEFGEFIIETHKINGKLCSNNVNNIIKNWLH